MCKQCPQRELGSFLALRQDFCVAQAVLKLQDLPTSASQRCVPLSTAEHLPISLFRTTLCVVFYHVVSKDHQAWWQMPYQARPHLVQGLTNLPRLALNSWVNWVIKPIWEFFFFSVITLFYEMCNSISYALALLPPMYLWGSTTELLMCWKVGVLCG